MNNPWLNPLDGKAAAAVLVGALAGQATGIDCAFIFGSLAAGSERPDSDVDLFVLGSIDGRELSRLTRCLSDLSLGRVLNSVLYDDAEFRMRLRDRNHFVLNVINGPKLFVVGTEETLRRAREC